MVCNWRVEANCMLKRLLQVFGENGGGIAKGVTFASFIGLHAKNFREDHDWYVGMWGF